MCLYEGNAFAPSEKNWRIFCFYIDIREPRKSLYFQGFRAWLSLFRTDFYVRLGKPITPVDKGTVFDVAVDLRSGSETYGKWYGIELSEENKKQFLIPRGFAHGCYRRRR